MKKQQHRLRQIRVQQIQGQTYTKTLPIGNVLEQAARSVPTTYSKQTEISKGPLTGSAAAHPIQRLGNAAMNLQTCDCQPFNNHFVSIPVGTPRRGVREWYARQANPALDASRRRPYRGASGRGALSTPEQLC